MLPRFEQLSFFDPDQFPVGSGMRTVHGDEFADQVGRFHDQLPGDDAAPVVSQEHALVFTFIRNRTKNDDKLIESLARWRARTQASDHLAHVVHQHVQLVILYSSRLVRVAIASHVNCNDPLWFCFGK